MGQTTFQRAFSGGEIAPQLAARADQVKYVTGLRTCRNFVVLKHGGVSNRAGLRFIERTRDSATDTFLLRYVSEVAGESVLIEAGPGYLRFFKEGALLRISSVPAWDSGTSYVIGDIAASGGVNYYCVQDHLNHAPPNASYWYAMPSDILELPSPFGNGKFAWVQSANVITMTSLVVPPHELINEGLTRWVIRAVSTAPTLPPPTSLAITGGVAGTLSYEYIVTAAATDSYEESIGSAAAQVNTIDVPTPANPNVLTWDAVVGAAAYNVYKDPYGNGTFGFIGTATGLASFRDVGFDPDFTSTPPTARILFASTDNYPATAGYYQQRRFFGNLTSNPDAIFGSRIGFPSNFNTSIPLQADDAITFKIAGNRHNPVRHLADLKALIVLTDAGIWTVGAPKTILAPNSIPADQDTYVGVNADVAPVIVGSSLLYVHSRGSIVYDVQFDLQIEGLGGRDLTLFAGHLFEGFAIARLDYQPTPQSIVWAVRDDGTLLGVTYIREQEILGWHRHDTGAAGRFEDVCVVPEPGEDAVYVLVRRTISGAFVRYIERLEKREIVNFGADAFFVDAGLTYSGAPATTIAGLGHLEGEVVAIVGDGRVIFNGDTTAANAAQYRVTGGTIAAALPASSVIHAGLPIQYAEIETLDLDVSGANVRDKKKRVGSLGLLLDASVRTFFAGPDRSHLLQHKVRPFETGLEGTPVTGLEEINLTADYNDAGRVVIRQVDPLPLTILGLLPNVELGG